MMPIVTCCSIANAALLLRVWIEYEANIIHAKMAAAARRQEEEVRKVRKDGKLQSLLDSE